MSRKISVPNLGVLVICGSIWGLSEATLGLALESCAKLVSGSIMIGVALFFISAAWTKTRRAAGPAIIVLLALVFKLIDALLLGLPIKHGAVANPMFAFVTEGLAFLIFVPFIAEAWKNKVVGQAFLGGASALLAVNLFPLVKFATGIPACVFPGSTIPLSLYYAPIAIVVSLITVPLGFAVARKVETLEGKIAEAGKAAWRWLIPSAALVLCLIIQAIIRLV
jgi:hypothetical protein